MYEVGPRFEMRLYQLRLGTLDQKEAEYEYVLGPYQNTATKRQVLQPLYLVVAVAVNSMN